MPLKARLEIAGANVSIVASRTQPIVEAWAVSKQSRLTAQPGCNPGIPRPEPVRHELVGQQNQLRLCVRWRVAGV